MGENTFYAGDPILPAPVTVITKEQAASGHNSVSMPQAVMQVGDYEFAVGAAWEDTVEPDVSSAFRAELAKKGSLNPTDSFGGSESKDRVQLAVTYFTRFLGDGEICESTKETGGTFTAWRGGRWDSERFMAVGQGGISGTPDGTPVSVKPVDDSSGNDWEVVNVGDTVRCGSSSMTAEISTATDASTGIVTKVAAATFLGRRIYVEDNPLRYQFMFESHLGFIESASCLMRESKSYKITSEDRYRTYAPSYTIQSSLFSKKSGGRAIWKMSSGYVTRAWAEWFATEFLMSPKHWLWTNGTWLPVSITPDSDSTTVYDESKGELIAINFTVTSGIKGRI